MLIKEREKITKGLAEILKIMDKGSFVEIGARACDKETEIYSPEVICESDGVVTGYGTIDGKAVFVFCQDEDIMGGSMGVVHAEKISRIYKMAVKVGAPLIGIMNSTGFRVEEAADGLNAFATLYKEALNAKEKILQIIIKQKDFIGSMAVLAESADFIIEKEESNNIEAIKQLINILPPVKGMKPEPGEIKDDLNRLCTEIDENDGDCLKFLRKISDENFLLHYKPHIGKGTVTSFIRLAGRTIGVIGNISEKGEVAMMSAEGTEKAAQFVKLCSSLNIGLLTLPCNGGVDSEEAKTPRMIKSLCSFAENMAVANIPKVCLLSGRSTGVGYMLMGNKAFGIDIVFAWPSAKVMMMNPNQAVTIIYTGIKPADVNEKVVEYEQCCCDMDFFLKRGYTDKVITPEESRKYLIGAFETFYNSY